MRSKANPILAQTVARLNYIAFTGDGMEKHSDHSRKRILALTFRQIPNSPLRNNYDLVDHLHRYSALFDVYFFV